MVNEREMLKVFHTNAMSLNGKMDELEFREYDEGNDVVSESEM